MRKKVEIENLPYEDPRVINRRKKEKKLRYEDEFAEIANDEDEIRH